MKTLTIFIFSFLCLYGYGQTDPEDFIIVYDFLNSTEKVLVKSELSSNLDSLSSYLIEDKREELLTAQDSLTVHNLLIGNWSLESVKRTNGIPFKLLVADKMEFNADGKFVLINQNDSTYGEWKVIKDSYGNLLLNYSEPQIAIKDKEILEYLSDEQIKSMTYSSNILSIREIDNTALILMTFITENTENYDEMFYRLVLETFKKHD